MRGSARGWLHCFRAETQNNHSILGVETKPRGETMAAAAAAFTSEPTDQLLTLRSPADKRCIGSMSLPRCIICLVFGAFMEASPVIPGIIEWKRLRGAAVSLPSRSLWRRTPREGSLPCQTAAAEDDATRRPRTSEPSSRRR